VIATIQQLMEHDTAGDPISGLKWTRKTTKKISRQLGKLAIRVSASTVARLLKELDFALRTNKKTISHGSTSERDGQFRRITSVKHRFLASGLPIVSVDTKKRELIGQFKNPGATWRTTPTRVNDHDFRSLASGVGIPFGIYDPQANRGFIGVGTSYDTAALAGDTLAAWWSSEGCRRYPKANRLLILADCGGANGPKNTAWKCILQTKLADGFGLAVRVCHYPPGASKWNPIEHRLFSEIQKNWAGQPLSSYETMLNYLRTTRTEKGLRVRAKLFTRHHPKGQKPSREAVAGLNITPHGSLPAWNYTVLPAAHKLPLHL
jgi:hypothetical protein